MEDFGASLRESTYNATTAVQEYLALFKGLSRSIMQLSDSVKNLRACLIVRVSNEYATLRKQLTLSYVVHKRETTALQTT